MIGFLNPLVLVGLALAGLPPLLHLLGRRQPPTVPFPAVRYLTAAEREHSRKLKLRNLLLMLLRMLLIVLIVLAAARPVVPLGVGTSHPPAALAMVVDNSLSSGAVVEGRAALDVLRARALAAASRTTVDDRLWIVGANGVPDAVSRSELIRMLDTLTPQPNRLDLGAAVRTAAATIAPSGLALREVVVFSDLQASAVTSGAPVSVPVLVATPPAAPHNHGVDSIAVEPPVWTTSGEVVATVGGTGAQAVAVRLTIDGEEQGRAVGRAGEHVVLRAEPPRRGWLTGTVQLDPDELRADDRRWFAVRATLPVAVRTASALGSFVTEGLDVLVDVGQLRSGNTVSLGDRPVSGVSVVFPPAEPAMLGAVNRALASAGVAWRFTELLEGEWTLDASARGAQGAPVFRRYRLSGSGAVLATVSGEPWLVQDGSVTLVASRLQPDWTALPTSAAFLPFLHYLIADVAVGEAGVVTTTAGRAVTVPAGAMTLAMPGGDVHLPPGSVISAPREPGAYMLRGTGTDTVGFVVVNHDARESDLTPATAAQIAAAWGANAQVLGNRELERSLFGGAARAELSTVLLIAALVTALIELVVSGFGARAARR